MLKSIATARSECTTKENKASYNTYYIAPDLIHFFGNDWKEIKTQNIVSSPSWDQGENDFCAISQPGGATAKLQEPGWVHIQWGDDFRQSSRGGGTALWWIVGISTKCFSLNFTNFACGAILHFSNFFIKRHY